MNGLPKWFGHVNLNVSDLPRSQQFYETVLGMRVLVHMETSQPQDGGAFLIDSEVSWVGRLLVDDRELRGPLLDMLHWAPAANSTNSPTAEEPILANWGLSGLIFSTDQPTRLTQALSQWGTSAHKETVKRVNLASGEEEDATVFELYDPDGVALEVRSDPQNPPRFIGVRVTCSSIAASTKFYESVLGMKVKEEHTVTTGRTQYVRRLLQYAGSRNTFNLELWEPQGSHTLNPPPQHGNQVGLYRMALVTDDFPASLRHLKQVLPTPPRVASIDIGAGVGPLDAVFFDDPDGTVVEFVSDGIVGTAERNQRTLVTEDQ